MKIIIALKTSIYRSVRSWKTLLIIWVTSLLLVSMVALPVKSAFNSDLGKSMITEKLTDGFNIEVFTDLGTNLRSLMSFFSTGFFLAVLLGFLFNSFLAGGFFNSLKSASTDFSMGEFLRSSAKNFWSFLVITLLLSLIIFILIVISAFLMQMAIEKQSELQSRGMVFRTAIFVIPLFISILTILLLVADYARAWQVSKDKNACFGAIGFGFSQSFRTFLSSFPLMIILLIIQLSFGWFVFSVLSGLRPSSGGGVFLLFIFSQLLFIIRIFLRALRYGSITALMEMKTQQAG